MITRLCALADLPKPQIAIVRTEVLNAFAAGRSPNKAFIAVTTGIRNKLSPAELEAVLAHELSHVKNRDMAVITIASLFDSSFYFVRYSLYFNMEEIGGVKGKHCSCLACLHCSLDHQFSAYSRSFPLQEIFCRQRLGHHYRTAVGSCIGSHENKWLMDRVPDEDLRQMEGMNAFFIIPAISGSSIMNLFSTHPSVEKG